VSLANFGVQLQHLLLPLLLASRDLALHFLEDPGLLTQCI
jgi:hypothetical protein